MKKKNNIKSGMWKAIYFATILAGLICIAIINTSCASKRNVSQESVKEYIHDTTKVCNYLRDSIYFRDSIYIVADTAGKPVYQERWHTKYIQNTRIDTLFQNKIQYKDSIKTVIETKEVKKNGVFAKFCMGFFIISLIVLLLWTAWKVYKKFYLGR